MLPCGYDLSRNEIEYLINQFIFSKRDRLILQERLIEGYTYEKISEEFNLSVSQTKNIIRKNKEIVFRHIDRLPKLF